MISQRTAGGADGRQHLGKGSIGIGNVSRRQIEASRRHHVKINQINSGHRQVLKIVGRLGGLALRLHPLPRQLVELSGTFLVDHGVHERRVVQTTALLVNRKLEEHIAQHHEPTERERLERRAIDHRAVSSQPGFLQQLHRPGTQSPSQQFLVHKRVVHPGRLALGG